MQIQKTNIPVKYFIQPYLKISNAFAGWEASGNLDKKYYLKKSDYEDIFNNLHGKWCRNEEKSDFEKNGKNFIDEILLLEILNKDNFVNKIEDILNSTNRKQIIISLGFYVEFEIPISELEKADINFDSKKDIDELAEPMYNFIMKCKEMIEE